MLLLSFDIGIKNLAYCLIDIDKHNFSILDWNVLDCSLDTKSVASIDVIREIVKQLNSLEYLQEADIILVEKQPSCNPKMRIINSCIFMYFIIKAIDNNLNTKIINYSPKHKLKCCNLKLDKISKNKYTNNKKLAIKHTSHLIRDTSWEPFFVKASKKDDLADCFLQAKSYFL